MSTQPLNPKQPKTYRDVLVTGLKARRPSELAFIGQVVLAVEQGRLPARLVDSTFFWARGHAGNNLFARSNRPIVYFIPALKARAKRLKLTI
jgi:hypothetical protein